jgi:diacylglycerol kinase (ATP)
MKYHLIYNPTARSGRSMSDFKKILRMFQEHDIEFDKTLTEKKDHAIEIARRINKNESSVVVAVGGDGTIGEVITGLMQQPKEERPILGVLHIGTSPDFPRYHQIPTSISEAVEFLFQASPVEIDVGKIVCWNLSKKKSIVSYFGCGVNIGLGPNIASKSNNRYRAYLGDFLGTLLATIVSLAQYKKSKIVIETDNNEQELDHLINLTVGKDPHLASGMRIPIDMPVDNGKFYYMAIQSSSKIKLLIQLWRLYRGNILDYPGAILGYGNKMVISSNDLDRVEFDGDVRGHLPATIEIIPRAIKVLKRLKSS